MPSPNLVPSRYNLIESLEPGPSLENMSRASTLSQSQGHPHISDLQESWKVDEYLDQYTRQLKRRQVAIQLQK